MPTTEKIIQVAHQAAREAGEILNSMFGRLEENAVVFKGEIDLVTEADRMAEERIIKVIRGSFPTHGIQAEESGRLGGGDYCWIIDPLDGTTNFAHGFPWYAVSIAVQRDGETVVGVVYHCTRDEMYTGEKGAGAYCGDRRLQVSEAENLINGLFVTGYPYEMSRVDQYVRQTGAVLPRCRGLRRTGSAALNLCYVANGTFSGFWEFSLQPWDIAAGNLLVQEAGGVVTGFSGEPVDLNRGDVVATNGKLHCQLLNLISPEHRDADASEQVVD